ncbi:MAG: transglycosylase domain-containing protein [bacterium]|nr:transglycosylase domain-containing protein [bacterium]
MNKNKNININKKTNNVKIKSHKKNNAIFSNKMFLLIIIILILVIIGCVSIGPLFTIFIIIGIICILFISYLVNKITKHGKRKKLFNFLIIIFLITCIIGISALILFFLYIVNTAPEFDNKKLINSETTLMYDSKGTLIAELGATKRENITYDEMSEVLVDAIIATEDSRFFQHNGVDAARFLKASVGQLIGKSNAGGASTLSMQVIKNSFTSSEANGIKGIIRKFTDIYLAVFKLEKQYSKEEIIEFYANNHFLGSNSYGVEQASKTYFGKNAKDLNLAEASLIVGMFKAPTSYNPFINPDAATARRKTVLNLMYNHGYITKEEMDIANSIPVESLLVTESGDSSIYQGYIDTVVEEIQNKYNVNPYNTPMLIYTNMDSKRQEALNDVFNNSFKWINSFVQAGVAAVDVKTGKIVAIGNGRNRNGVSTYNFATQINRQIGSTAKPIIDYAPGMEYLNWSTYTIFSDSKYYYSSGQEMHNSDNTYMGNISIRTALAQSRNIPALKAFQMVSKEIGKDKYKKFVESFGIKTEEYFHEAHSIGAFNGSNPLAMAAAYAVFANGGYYYEPYSVNKIVYRDTDEVIEYKSEGKRVISDSTAFMITDCLRTAVTNGLSSGAKMNGYTISAKTGTTNYDSAYKKQKGLPSNAIPDSWIIGYDSEISVSLWYGCENADKDHYITLANGGPQRNRLYQAIIPKLFNKGNEFEVPDSVVKVAIEKGTNPAKLASDSTPSNKITYEYFKKGTEPTETSIKYSKLNNVSNLKGNYNASDMSMTLSWSATSSKPSNKEEYGELGYKIYKNDNYIAFTTDTSYTILNVTNPEGTYKVVTSYKNYDDNASSGTTYTYTVKPVAKVYDSSLKYSSSTYNINDSLSSYDQLPSKNDVIVTLNGENVTSFASIDITIKDNSGNIVSNIDNSKQNIYTIIYIVNYETYTKTLSRTVTIQ